MDVSWAARLSTLHLTRRERMVGATTIAAVIVFGGLLLDLPSVKRVKALDAERIALGGQVTGLQQDLGQLAGKRREVEEDAARFVAPPSDPRISALMRDITGIEGRQDVEFVAVRPAPSTGNTSAVTVEMNAPLRVLGPYWEALARSRWMLLVEDVRLARNPERVPSVSVRFTVSTPFVVRGLVTAESGKPEAR